MTSITLIEAGKRMKMRIMTVRLCDYFLKIVYGAPLIFYELALSLVICPFPAI
jgi:hypothetical protein